MKVRQGFVSNSSSTSFYINADTYSIEQVNDAMTKFLEILNSLHEGSSYSPTDAYTIEVSTAKKLLPEIAATQVWDENKNVESRKIKTYVRFHLKDFPENVISIDSTNDNSIPYSLQEFLENEFNAIRKHWG